MAPFFAFSLSLASGPGFNVDRVGNNILNLHGPVQCLFASLANALFLCCFFLDGQWRCTIRMVFFGWSSIF
jgi:hypothetical protein